MVGVGRMRLGPSGPPQLGRTGRPPGPLPGVCSHCMLGESLGSIHHFSRRLLSCVHTRIGLSEYQVPGLQKLIGLIFFSAVFSYLFMGLHKCLLNVDRMCLPSQNLRSREGGG